MLMGWIDERRIEMQAEGRRHWVPSVRDFEQAMRDVRDDLVGQPNHTIEGIAMRRGDSELR
jgi:hypothetical protein